MTVRIRKQHPRPRKNYKSYKRFLRLELDYTCAYCDLTERERGGSCNFGCDHYRPKSLFPELITDYENLLYACSRCNAFKQDFWPSGSRTNVDYVLNPFTQDVDMHIDKSLPKWQPKTVTGYFNIHKLQLASEGKIAERENRVTAQKLLIECREKLAQALTLQAQAKECGAQDIDAQLENSVNLLRNEITFWVQRLTPELDND